MTGAHAPGIRSHAGNNQFSTIKQKVLGGAIPVTFIEFASRIGFDRKVRC